MPFFRMQSANVTVLDPVVAFLLPVMPVSAGAFEPQPAPIRATMVRAAGQSLL
jgi:hypothetical protein